MIIATQRVVFGMHQKLTIVPVADIHHNAPGFDADKFTEIMNWIAATGARADRRIGVILLGDYLDTFSKTEREYLGKPGLHETSRGRIERMLRDDLGDFLEALGPARPYVWGVIEGNHTYLFQDARVSGSDVGKSVSRVIAEHLGVPYFGVCGCLVLQLAPSARTTKMWPFKIVMHHGFGAATTKSASILQMQKLRDRFPAMNLYIMAHNHAPIGTVMQGLDVRCNSKTGQYRLAPLDQAFVRASSFLRGYLEGHAVDCSSGSYVEERCLVPQGLGVVTCNVRWKTARAGNPPRNEPTGLLVHVQE